MRMTLNASLRQPSAHNKFCRYQYEDGRMPRSQEASYNYHARQQYPRPSPDFRSRRTSRRWPPYPKVEDEEISLSREYNPQVSDRSNGEAQMRGALDQQPIILETEYTNKDETSLKSKSSVDSLGPRTPPASDNQDRRYVYIPQEGIEIPFSYDEPLIQQKEVPRARSEAPRGRKEVPRLNMEHANKNLLDEIPIRHDKMPAPYAYASKPHGIHHPGDCFLSPDVLSPQIRLPEKHQMGVPSKHREADYFQRPVKDYDRIAPSNLSSNSKRSERPSINRDVSTMPNSGMPVSRTRTRARSRHYDISSDDSDISPDDSTHIRGGRPSVRRSQTRPQQASTLPLDRVPPIHGIMSGPGQPAVPPLPRAVSAYDDRAPPLRVPLPPNHPFSDPTLSHARAEKLAASRRVSPLMAPFSPPITPDLGFSKNSSESYVVKRMSQPPLTPASPLQPTSGRRSRPSSRPSTPLQYESSNGKRPQSSAGMSSPLQPEIWTGERSSQPPPLPPRGPLNGQGSIRPTDQRSRDNSRDDVLMGGWKSKASSRASSPIQPPRSPGWGSSVGNNVGNAGLPTPRSRQTSPLPSPRQETLLVDPRPRIDVRSPSPAKFNEMLESPCSQGLSKPFMLSQMLANKPKGMEEHRRSISNVPSRPQSPVDTQAAIHRASVAVESPQLLSPRDQASNSFVLPQFPTQKAQPRRQNSISLNTKLPAPCSEAQSSRRSFEIPRSPVTSSQGTLPATRPKTPTSKSSTSRPIEKQPLSLPCCPRPLFSADHNDWYTLVGCSTFDICPTCREAVSSAGYERHLTPSPKRPYGSETRCDFSIPWFRMAWLLTLKEKRSHVNLLHAMAQGAAREPPCPGKIGAVREWYRVTDPNSGNQVSNFEVCSCCIRSLETIFPILRGVFKKARLRFPSEERSCDLRADSKRFATYVDLLEEIAKQAEESRRPPNTQRFVELAKTMSFVRECSRDDMVLGQAWHIMPQVPELTVCEECYEDVVVPAIEDGQSSSLAAQFNPSVQMVAPPHVGVSCQLYSPRMRKAFQEACSRNDGKLLRNVAVQRHWVERDLQRRRGEVLKFGGEEGRRLVLELAEEWKRWE